jgi:hypothetical protein
MSEPTVESLKATVAALEAELRKRKSPQRHPLKDRGDDCNETPAEAVWALLRVERVPRVVREPACGPGAIVRELRAAGHIVHASDLVDYGCPDSEARVDFLMEWRALPDVECILTNPPNKLATEFAEHALQLCPLVMLLQPVQWLGSEKRTRLFDGPLTRVHVFKSRLPMMHRLGWTGAKNTSQIYYAWFVFERGHTGPALLDRIDWKNAGRGERGQSPCVRVPANESPERTASAPGLQVHEEKYAKPSYCGDGWPSTTS